MEKHELGDMIRGKEIGRKTDAKLIWVQCPDCFRERWVQYKPTKINLSTRSCKDCSINHSKRNFFVGLGHTHKNYIKRIR